jgi:hypothetical protein
VKAWIAVPSAGAMGSLPPPWHFVWRGGSALGVANGFVIRQLTVLSHAVSVDGGAAQEIDRSLDSLPGLRLIGPGVGRTVMQVQRAGASVVAVGGSSTGSIRSLGMLRAVAVALMHWLDAGPTVVLVQRAVSTLGSGPSRVAARGCGEPGKRLPKRLAACELRRVRIDPGSSERGESGS